MQCTHHTHTNANCFIQHLEKRRSGTREGSRAPSGKKDSKEKKNNKKDRKWKKGKDKRAAAAVHSEKDTDSDADLSDSDDDDSGGVSATAIAAMSSKNMNSTSIIMDSGTSYHFFNNRSWFNDLQRLKKPISFSLAIGQASCTHLGTISIVLKNNEGKLTTLMIKKCIYSPKSRCNLISVGRLWDKKRVEGQRSTGELLMKGVPIGLTKLISYVDVIQEVTILPATIDTTKHQQPVKLQNNIAAPAVARPKADTERWHQRLAHIGSQTLNAIKAKAPGLEDVDPSTLSHCEVCKLSKSQRVVSRRHRAMPGQPLDEIHVDT